jgi:hypothetical protein
MKPVLLLTLLLSLLAITNLPAAQIYVSPFSQNPTPPYSTWSTAATTIQDALNAASSGSFLIVTNGYYRGGIVLNKPVTIQSVNGPQFTFIDGNRGTNCISLIDGSFLSGFTLTNGFAQNGGGVWAPSNSSYVTNCIISGNYAAQSGAGAYGPVLFNCSLIGNSATNGTGGGACHCVLVDCTLIANSVIGGVGGGACYSDLSSCLLYANDDGAAAYSTLRNCTLSGNTGGPFGVQSAFECVLYNSIVYYNSSPNGDNHIASQLNYCCTIPMPTNGVGNITNAPLFVDPAAGDFHLQAGSPCIDTGNNSFVYGTTDLDGNPRVMDGVVDMGAYEFFSLGPPLITSQPASQTVYAGSNVTFTVGAAGLAPLSWRWLFNGPLLVGTNSSLLLTLVTTNQAGDYSVVISNSLGSATSQVAVLTVLAPPPAPPSITQQPQPSYAVAYAGTNMTFTVQASGAQPLYYQWLFNGTQLLDVTNSSLNLPVVLPSQAGNYSVVITNAFGSITSQVAVLVVVQGNAPTISQQPVDQTVLSGTLAFFTVQTSNSLPSLSWQWFLNGKAVPGAIAPTIIITNATDAQAGSYFVVITNFVGSVTSQVAVLTVLDTPPSFTLTPTNQSLYVGSSGYFAAFAQGAMPISYQWFFNGAPISFANSQLLFLNSVTKGQAGNYSIVITNSFGSVTSQVAVLTVLDSAPVFTLQPVSQSVPAGTNVSFTAAASGSLPISWQWLFNGDPIPGATGPSLSMAPVATSQAGDYTVTASNYLGSTSSQDAILTVNQPPTHYVWQDSPHPAPPYTNWDTAAHVIQDAVDAAGFNEQILVTNGTYATGGRTAASSMLTNRVTLDRPMSLLSVNGPGVTIIQGYQVPGATNGPAAVRCVYLGTNCVVSGFTLTGGATWPSPNTSQSGSDVRGGGIYSEPWGMNLAQNCKLIGNSAAQSGGGAFTCALCDCLIVGNTAGNFVGASGGGTAFCALTNCTITGNYAFQGGGATVGSLYNCILYYNISSEAGDENLLADKGGYITFCDFSPLQAPPEWQNINVPPLFVDPAHGDYHLQPNSPCINAGRNAFAAGPSDLDGNPRIAGGTVDLGAYEYQSPTSQLSYAWLQQWGLPTDGSADFADTDGDGMNNWQEWVCGTCPTNPLSALRLLSATPSGGSVSVTWQSVAGISYHLQRSSDVSSSLVSTNAFLVRSNSVYTNLVLIATNIYGQAGSTTFVDTNAADVRGFFYRVGVKAP